MERIKFNSGITLISLVLTIIIIIILSVITLNIFTKHVDNYIEITDDVKYRIAIAKEKEKISLAYDTAVFKKSITSNTLTIDATDLGEELEDAEVKPASGNSIAVTFNDSHGRYLVDENKNIIYLGGTRYIVVGEEVAVTRPDGTEEIINKDNVGEYIGEPVINYAPPTPTDPGANAGDLRIGANVYTLSTTYKLYYIDFDNKYKDGKGTIYLKADYIPNQYTCPTDGNIETSLIEKFNPSMYKEGVTTPSITSTKMKSAIWLLDTTKWSSLIDTDAEIADKINYVVGAPSLELMFDSYNQYYGLTGDTPTKPTGTERVKLFYRFSSGSGYVVAPNGSSSAEYGQYLIKNGVRSDPDIDPMYYPGLDKAYYLASPSTKSNYSLMRVLGSKDMGGFVSYTPKETSQNCFCPIISLAPDCVLNLGN